MAHLAKTDFHSGHDLMVPEFKPQIRLAAVNPKCAWDPQSPYLSDPPLLALPLSNINKLKKKKEKRKKNLTIPRGEYIEQ